MLISFNKKKIANDLNFNFENQLHIKMDVALLETKVPSCKIKLNKDRKYIHFMLKSENYLKRRRRTTTTVFPLVFL